MTDFDPRPYQTDYDRMMNQSRMDPSEMIRKQAQSQGMTVDEFIRYYQSPEYTSEYEQPVEEEISPEQLIQSLKQTEPRYEQPIIGSSISPIRVQSPEPSDEELQRVLRLIRERYQ